MAQSTGAMETLNLAKSWLENCMQCHQACRPQETEQTWPTRLIEIESSSPRLVSSSGLPGRFKYATLSHCWGTYQYLRLLKGNLRSFYHEIPTHSLSKTFTDSITIAKHLGMSYLWIDSLCIIQDDDDDWRRESRKMSDIYGYSTVNIAANGAKDGSTGCFFDRDVESRGRLAKACMPLPEFRREDNVVVTYDCIWESFCEDDIEAAPLSSRGWCFQETYPVSSGCQVLRPRLPSFSKATKHMVSHSKWSCYRGRRGWKCSQTAS